MEDREFVEHVARQCVERYGAGAVDVLRGYADRAATAGDGPSAKTWLDITEAAERLLGS